jgi:hypothetical protein
MQDYKNFKNETWDGQPIKCRVVTITVADDHQFKYYWARPYVGQQRQVLEVQSAESTFYIDNEGGSGIYKVVGGAHMGKGHRSLKPEPYTAIREVDEDKIIYPTPEVYQAANDKIEADCASFFGPEYVEQHKRMLETFAAFKQGKFNFNGNGK